MRKEGFDWLLEYGFTETLGYYYSLFYGLNKKK